MRKTLVRLKRTSGAGIDNGFSMLLMLWQHEFNILTFNGMDLKKCTIKVIDLFSNIMLELPQLLGSLLCDEAL